MKSSMWFSVVGRKTNRRRRPCITLTNSKKWNIRFTAKPIIYVANVNENELAEDNDYVKTVRAVAAEQNAEVVKLCAKLEEEMAGLSDEERHEFLESLSVTESGLEQVIHKGYKALGLISYFTAGPKEVRAWTIRRALPHPKRPA